MIVFIIRRYVSNYDLPEYHIIYRVLPSIFQKTDIISNKQGHFEIIKLCYFIKTYSYIISYESFVEIKFLFILRNQLKPV